MLWQMAESKASVSSSEKWDDGRELDALHLQNFLDDRRKKNENFHLILQMVCAQERFRSPGFNGF